MKKYVVVISVLIMSLVLASCGGSSDDANKTTTKDGWTADKIFSLKGEVKASWTKGVEEGMPEESTETPITYYSNDEYGNNEIIIYNNYFEQTDTEEDVIAQAKEDGSSNWANYEVTSEEEWTNDNIKGYLIKAAVSGGGVEGTDIKLLIFGKGYYYEILYTDDKSSSDMTEEDFTKFINSLKEQTQDEQDNA